MISLKIDPGWQVIPKLRETVEGEGEITKFGANFLEATAVAAVELVENALKYAAGGDDSKSIEFLLEIRGDELIVKVSNRSNSKKSSLHG